ncbi:MAG: helix-turn-helix transcriptional regulator [Chloroflexi bacterium]|nr:helix-turn-helix transcriptional regulator [Chloroflexota bacterium]
MTDKRIVEQAAIEVQEGDTIDHLELLAKWFRGLDDPVRLGILEALRSGEKSVDELCEALGMKQPRISNHLACLRWCQFVATRRESQRIYYRLADPNVERILELAHASLARNAERVYSCTRA